MYPNFIYSQHCTSNKSNKFNNENLGFDLYSLNEYYGINFCSLQELLYFIQFNKRYDILTYLCVSNNIQYFKFEEFILYCAIYYDDSFLLKLVIDDNPAIFKQSKYLNLYNYVIDIFRPNCLKILIQQGIRYRRNKILKHLEKYSIDSRFMQKIINDKWWVSFIIKDKWITFQFNCKPRYVYENKAYPNLKQHISNLHFSRRLKLF